MEFASYIIGFVDGEGTVCVSFNKRAGIKTGIEVRPSFSISQHKRSLSVLQAIQKYFRVGSIRFNAKDQNYKYEVRSVAELWSVIVPHFHNYPLQTAKRNDFDRFAQIVSMLKEHVHRDATMIRVIIDIAYEMNESGKRKIEKTELLRYLAR